MIKIKRAVMTAMVSFAVAATMPVVPGRAGAAEGAIEPSLLSASIFTIAGAQDGCPLIFPDGPVAVAPNQPAVQDRSTIGIINALCDVTLDFVGCGFTPSSITIACDIWRRRLGYCNPSHKYQGDQRIPPSSYNPCARNNTGKRVPPRLLWRPNNDHDVSNHHSGDDNIFGPFTQTINCSIDLGLGAGRHFGHAIRRRLHCRTEPVDTRHVLRARQREAQCHLGVRSRGGQS